MNQALLCLFYVLVFFLYSFIELTKATSKIFCAMPSHLARLALLFLNGCALSKLQIESCEYPLNKPVILLSTIKLLLLLMLLMLLLLFMFMLLLLLLLMLMMMLLMMLLCC